ncbi:hypothetical protein PBRA_001160 [Plasmodiophora brassicae]|uniref:RBR-type E3 ubiquitin transferase n=1 Tax=Plasmodiophora brassicae TaxID=37360 RepID=A0A0G4IVV0_PLABS|nr:hypothetical protein PBRA_001160 [Plasmodiophora brassicae]
MRVRREQPCPVCGRSFPSSTIEAHVNVCLDSEQSFIGSAASNNRPRDYGNDSSRSGYSGPVGGGGAGPEFALRPNRRSRALDSDWHPIDTLFDGDNIHRLYHAGGVILLRPSCLQGNADSKDRSLISRITHRSVRNLCRPARRRLFVRATFDETTKDIALRNEFDEGALLPVHDYFGPSKVDVKLMQQRRLRSDKSVGFCEVRLSTGSFNCRQVLQAMGGMLNADTDSLCATLSQYDRNDQVPLGFAVFIKSQLLKLQKNRSGFAGIWMDFLYIPTDIESFYGGSTKASSRLSCRSGCERSSSPSPDDPSRPSSSKRCPPVLHFVAALGSRSLTEWTLRHCDTSNMSLFGNRYASHVAALFGHVECVDLLLSHELSARAAENGYMAASSSRSHQSHLRTDTEGRNILHYAVMGNSIHSRALDVLNVLSGFDVNATDNSGRTPLMQLASQNTRFGDEMSRIELALALLKRGASIDIQDLQGDTPLIACTRRGDHLFMKWLLERSTQSQSIFNYIGENPLSVATEMHSTESLSVLADVDAFFLWPSPRTGRTALHCAAGLGNLDSVKTLLDALARCETRHPSSSRRQTLLMRDFDGKTARHLALEYAHSSPSHQAISDLLTATCRIDEDKSVCMRDDDDDEEGVDDDYEYVAASNGVDPRSIAIGNRHPSEQQEGVEPASLSESKRLRSFGSIGNDKAVLEAAAVASEHLREVQEVASVLQAMAHQDFHDRRLDGPLHVPISTAALLLRHFRWNMDRLLASFAEDPVATCCAAGVTVRNDADLTDDSSEYSRSVMDFTCVICHETFPKTAALGLPCGHYFDVQCWRGHLRARLADGPSCVFATCPAVKCREIVHEDMWHRVFEEESRQIQRYSAFLLRSYVELNPNLIWCPSPTCDKALMFRGGNHDGKSPDLLCECGFRVCFRCSCAAHSPVDCKMMSRWRLQCETDGDNAEYIMNNSRQCPQCSVPIHRASGCNHIRCVMCNFEFCWLCMGAWASHGDATGGFYVCNLYDESMAMARCLNHDLSRFVHYLKRFQHHEESSRNAACQIEALQQLPVSSMTEYARMKHNLTLRALKELTASRHALKHSYVLTFYLEDGSQRHLLEHLQEMLEKHAEYLQELVSLPAPQSEDVTTEMIRNYTFLTHSFTRKLLEGADHLSLTRSAMPPTEIVDRPLLNRSRSSSRSVNTMSDARI